MLYLAFEASVRVARGWRESYIALARLGELAEGLLAVPTAELLPEGAHSEQLAAATRISARALSTGKPRLRHEESPAGSRC